MSALAFLDLDLEPLGGHMDDDGNDDGWGYSWW